MATFAEFQSRLTHELGSSSKQTEGADESLHAEHQEPRRSLHFTKSGGITGIIAAISLGTAAVLGCAKKDAPQSAVSLPDRPQVASKIDITPAPQTQVPDEVTSKITATKTNDEIIDEMITGFNNQSADESARLQAVETLGKIGKGNEKVIRFLCKILQNERKDPMVRCKAIEALGAIGAGELELFHTLTTDETFFYPQRCCHGIRSDGTS